MLQPIERVFQGVLTFLHDSTGGSWALAIVLLTLIVKLILHPLTRRQVRSMKAMQVLTPKMEEIRRRYKDDPQRMNQETMALYRAHNINPLSGCLPLVIQFPVLIALYNVLRTASFGGEALFGVGLSAVPTIQAIAANPILAIVPIAVGLSTYLQQKLTVTDPSQARMFVFMPIMIGYFSTVVPVGLSIYWFTSTVATIVEYLSILGLPRRRLPAAEPPAPPEPEERAPAPQPRPSRRKARRI